MPISAQVFTPYFAAEVPAQTFSIKIRDVPNAVDYTIPAWVYGGGLYYVRGGGSDDFGTAFAATLNAYATSSLFGLPAAFLAAFGTWSWTVTAANNAKGFTAYLQATGNRFYFPSSGFGIDGIQFLGLNWDLASVDVSGDERLLSQFFPAATWFPQVRANDLGLLPSPAQVSYSPLTADGSIAVVNMSPSPATLPVWWTLYLDGTIGVHGARMQFYRTAKPAWAAAIGVATGAPYCALDYPGGWWSLAVLGVPFIIGDQAVSGQYVGALRIHAGPECPEGMDPIRGLRAPTVSITGAAGGRRDLRLAFLYSGGLSGGSPY
jgi:hypothetical protein